MTIGSEAGGEEIRVSGGRVLADGAMAPPADALTTLVLHPNPARIRLWERQWAVPGDPFPPVARIPVAFALELAPLCRGSLPFAGPATLHLLVASLLAERGIHPSPGLVRRLAGLAQRQRDPENPWTITVPGEIAANLPGGALEALQAYPGALREAGHWDTAAMLHAVASDLADGRTLAARHVASRFRAVFLAGGRFLEPPERRLIGALGSCVPVQELEPGNGPPAETERLVVHQRSDYPRLAVGWVRRCLAEAKPGNPVDLESLVIVAPDPAVAADVARALEALGLPSSLPGHPVPLAGTRPAGILRMASSMHDGRIGAEGFEDLACHPLVTAGLPTPWLLPAILGKARMSTSPRTPAQWRDFLMAALEKDAARRERESRPDSRPPEAAKAAVAERIDLVEALCALLEKAAETRIDGDGLAGLASRAGHFLDSIGIREVLQGSRKPADLTPRELEVDQLAWENLADILSELARFEGLAGRAGALSVMDGQELMALAVGAESFSTAGREAGTIRVTRPEGVAGMRCHRLLWLGLEQGSYPRKPDGDGLMTCSEAALSEEMDFRYLAEGIRIAGGCTLARAAHDGPRQLPAGSFWDSREACQGGSPEQLPAQETVSHLLSLGCTGLDVAVDRARLGEPAGAGLDHWIRGLPHLRDGIAVMEAGPGISELAASAWPASRLFSATALESHAACPFLFHAKRTLGCREPEGPAPLAGRGEWIHKGLELASVEGAPYPPDAGRLAESLRNCLPDYAEAVDPYQATRIVEIAGGIGALASHESLRHLKVRGVEWETVVEFAGMDGLPGCFLEVRVDAILEADPGADGHLEVLLDCKTGSMDLGKARTRLASGRMQQPLVYALARMDWHRRQEGGRPPADLGAVLLTVPDSGEPKLIWLTGIEKKSKALPPIGSLGPKALEQVRLALLRQVADIRSGRMALATAGPGHKDTPCTAWCPGRDACRHPVPYQKVYRR